MSLRIRKNGDVLCAAMHSAEAGDTYIDDGLHYELSVVHGVLVTEPHELHQHHGRWWWSGHAPSTVETDPNRKFARYVDENLKLRAENDRLTAQLAELREASIAVRRDIGNKLMGSPYSPLIASWLRLCEVLDALEQAKEGK